MDIELIIKQSRNEYISTGESISYYEINNGLCENFAIDVVNSLGGESERLFIVGTDSFIDGEFWGGGVFDVKLLETFWAISPPDGVDWDDLEKAGMSEISHVWIAKDNRHYDAECPEGVDSFFELPIFKRSLVHYLRENGVQADEVETEDVIPAPLCPIPNPIGLSPS